MTLNKALLGTRHKWRVPRTLTLGTNMIVKFHNLYKRSMALSFAILILGFVVAQISNRLLAHDHIPTALVHALSISVGLAHFIFGLAQYFEVKALGRSTGLALALVPIGLLGFIITKHLSDRTTSLEYINKHSDNHDIQECPSCGSFYRISDYRDDVMQIVCSSCKTILREHSRSNIHE